MVDAARKHGTGVNVCGEMSGDPLFTPLLVGMGLRELSLAPNNLPDVKAIVRRLNVADAEQIAAEAKTLGIGPRCCQLLAPPTISEYTRKQPVAAKSRAEVPARPPPATGRSDNHFGE